MQLKSPVVLCALALVCLFVAGTAKADAVTLNVSNPDFDPSSSANVWSCGTSCSGTNGPISDWTLTNPANSGTWQPNSTVYNLSTLPTGVSNALWLNGGTASQDLGIGVLPDATYTLSVYVGDRADNYPTTYSFGLLDGSTVLASTPLLSNGPTSIPLGTFAPETFTFTTASNVTPGDLGIFVSDTGIQASFTDVSLTVTTPEPSSLVLLAIGLIGLLVMAKRYGFKPAIQVNPVC